MTIKSDQWIRRMAREHGMLEPFEPNQVREVDGRKVISYGTSSYGYDVRCANEFKIFTNVHTSNVVDPKNFDPSSFVSVTEDYCVIPPNSFALARTGLRCGGKRSTHSRISSRYALTCSDLTIATDWAFAISKSQRKASP